MRLAIAAAVLIGGAAQAAEPPPPVCSDPGVLRQVGEMIQARGQPLVLEAPPVGELSLARPGSGVGNAAPLAHCAVRGHTTGYDTNRYGMTPVNEPFIVNYTIEMRRHGLFVRLD